MSSRSRKLQHQQKSTQEQRSVSEQQHTAREFSSAEEMLRSDAEKAVVPPHIAVRLRESITRERPQRGWWQRLFGK